MRPRIVSLVESRSFFSEAEAEAYRRNPRRLLVNPAFVSRIGIGSRCPSDLVPSSKHRTTIYFASTGQVEDVDGTPEQVAKLLGFTVKGGAL